MNRTTIVVSLACVGALLGCAGTAPKELISARAAYLEASQGSAPQMAPTELHKAEVALAEAEASYSADARSFKTADLAYVAERRAQMAIAQASIATDQKNQARANTDYTTTQGSILEQKSRELAQTQSALELSKRGGQAAAERLSEEQKARAAAEMKTTQAEARTSDAETKAAAAETRSNQAEMRSAEAQAALAKMSALKEDARGMVITLSGSVVFRSGEAVLMPGAESRLNQVADALESGKGRMLVVEGYTDSQGSEISNLELSQRRAEAVRGYLIQRGYDPARVQARGLGEAQPVADNGTAEGRANNRRVEIVLPREDKQ